MIFSISTKAFQCINRISNNVKYSTTTGLPKQKWDIVAAVCLERKPVIAPEPNEIEKEYQEYLADLEFRNSLRNDIELRNEAEMKQEEALKAGGGDIDSEITLKQTVQDFIDASLEEASKFKFASRTTVDDTKNNVKSLNRKLDKHLVLLVDQQIGGRNFTILPQGKWKEGETLRQTAERILKESVGDKVKTQIYSNAPAGFYKYRYPKEIRDTGIEGAKIFIYFARHLKGQIENKNLNHKWLDRNELSKTLPAGYSKSVREMLIDE
ncbi:39S ribosomal protein L46, mitochondrial [Coccinella septempunctata]|uniref:39S ribosomal protein L46, mitochondrial n=1 Tax=Coccinella septempunctata TaxID=41139 RepID=UPI001D06A22B|nr:39S ribosomal protein L46, mitochondrial [Coccinella septempunctata]